MTRVLIVIAVIVFVAIRVLRRRSRGLEPRPQTRTRELVPAKLLGETGLVAERELRDRFRGKIFRFGTVLVVLAIVAAIVIPTLRHAGQSTTKVASVGTLPAPVRAAIVAGGRSVGTTVQLLSERDEAAANSDLRAGRVAIVVVDGRRLVTHKAIGSTDTSTTAQLARTLAGTLGFDEAIEAAGLTPAQAARIRTARRLPLTSLQPSSTHAARTTGLIGLPLLLFMFLTYNSWTMLGVMEEKSSRVVEVLLATVRPLQLLTGKVLGIGLTALTQATVIVGAALIAAKASGSDLASGTSPRFLVATFAWLLLGYAFYCWVYAAVGSLAERRDQVQSLLVPLNLPLVLAYIVALQAQSTGNASTLVKVLAYLPPTAPFAMPALVSLDAVAWWQFAASVLLTLASTVVVARLAATVYSRAILRTGRRVRLREVL
jgi:ABC-2 type transport system permease protein